MSIHYQARRSRPLSDDERTAIEALIGVHDHDRFTAAGGESFGVHADPDPGEIFAGSTKLPLGTAYADADLALFTEAIEHWMALLSAIRRVIPDAAWSASMDDIELSWDEGGQRYVLAG